MRSRTATRSKRPTKPPSRSDCRWRRRCCSRWSGRASQTTSSRRSPTLASFADGNDEIVVRGDARRSVDEIRVDVLEVVADEIRHMLEEGVVGAAADVDACLILGAGYPFFLGGITKHLDQTGVSERVIGSTLAEYGKIPA